MSRFILAQVKDAAIADKLDMLGQPSASAQISGNTVTVYALGRVIGSLTMEEAKILLVAKRDAQGRPVPEKGVPDWFTKNRAMWPQGLITDDMPQHVAALYDDEMDRRRSFVSEYYS